MLLLLRDHSNITQSRDWVGEVGQTITLIHKIWGLLVSFDYKVGGWSPKMLKSRYRTRANKWRRLYSEIIV